MNKYRFQFLIVLMSLALMGIILIQLYWIRTTYENKDDQFQHLVNQTIGKVADKVKEKERYEFAKKVYEYRTKTGEVPDRKKIKEIFYIEKDNRTNEEIVYSNIISVENFNDFNFGKAFIDSASGYKKDYNNYISQRKTEVYHGKNTNIDIGADIHQSMNTESKPDILVEKNGTINEFSDLMYYDIVPFYQLEDRLNSETLQNLIKQELKNNKVETNFEYAVFDNSMETPIKSKNFVFNDKNTYSAPILTDIENRSKYQLYINFPDKSRFLVSDLLPFIFISLLFTIVIIAAYYSAIRQLITQRQISEIKNDFINNMTHEFKTPIATINLALDAIKNPKIISDEDKVLRYVQMIRDENKRMHAQIEN